MRQPQINDSFIKELYIQDHELEFLVEDENSIYYSCQDNGGSQNIRLHALPQGEGCQCEGDLGEQLVKRGVNTFTIRVTKDGETLRSYVISVVVKSSPTDISLKMVLVNEDEALIPQGESYYFYHVPEECTQVDVEVIPRDPKAVIEGDTGLIDLDKGMNFLLIRVYSADQSNKASYQLAVERGDAEEGCQTDLYDGDREDAELSVSGESAKYGMEAEDESDAEQGSDAEHEEVNWQEADDVETGDGPRLEAEDGPEEDVESEDGPRLGAEDGPGEDVETEDGPRLEAEDGPEEDVESRDGPRYEKAEESAYEDFAGIKEWTEAFKIAGLDESSIPEEWLRPNSDGKGEQSPEPDDLSGDAGNEKEAVFKNGLGFDEAKDWQEEPDTAENVATYQKEPDTAGKEATYQEKAQSGEKAVSHDRDGADKSAESRLSELKVEGCQLNPQFSPDIYDYKVGFEGEIDNILVEAIPMDQNAALEGDLGLQTVVTGYNAFSLLCTASDGLTKSIYKYSVEKKKSIPPENIKKKAKSEVKSKKKDYNRQLWQSRMLKIKSAIAMSSKTAKKSTMSQSKKLTGIMLLLLCAIYPVHLYYTGPEKDRRAALETEALQVSERRSSVEERISNQSKTMDHIENYKERMDEIGNKYPYFPSQEEILYYLEGLQKEIPFTFTAISIGEASPVDISEIQNDIVAKNLGNVLGDVSLLTPPGEATASDAAAVPSQGDSSPAPVPAPSRFRKNILGISLEGSKANVFKAYERFIKDQRVILTDETRVMHNDGTATNDAGEQVGGDVWSMDFTAVYYQYTGLQERSYQK